MTFLDPVGMACFIVCVFLKSLIRKIKTLLQKYVQTKLILSHRCVSVFSYNKLSSCLSVDLESVFLVIIVFLNRQKTGEFFDIKTVHSYVFL
jgi:hypothetical protein